MAPSTRLNWDAAYNNKSFWGRAKKYFDVSLKTSDYYTGDIGTWER